MGLSSTYTNSDVIPYFVMLKTHSPKRSALVVITADSVSADSIATAQLYSTKEFCRLADLVYQESLQDCYKLACPCNQCQHSSRQPAHRARYDVYALAGPPSLSVADRGGLDVDEGD